MERLRMLLKTVLFIAGIYLMILAGMYLLQRKLVFVPDASPAYPKARGLEDITLVRLDTEDGEKLVAWYRPAQEGYPTIAYFHGNAGNLTDRTDKYRTLVDKGFGLLALSYRGYGGSTGSPTEDGLMIDARTAIHYLSEQRSIPVERMVFYGESLGSGVAVRMATENKVAGVVLEAPYTSVTNRAQELYPFLPVHFLLKDTFDSIHYIDKLQSPLLVLHGDADKVIPIAHGKALLEAAPDPKRGVFYPGIGHVDFDLLAVADAVHAFAEANEMIRTPMNHGQ